MKMMKPESCHFRPLVSLTTDFGIKSEGLGVMKGAIFAEASNANIIDLYHHVLPFSIVNGARAFETIKYLPVGIHVVVVDPGVGSERKAIALKTSRGDYLIGPDNGVMMNAARELGGITVSRIIEVSKKYNSNVFHGRDIFAYSAGFIASSESSFDNIGKGISSDKLTVSPLVDKKILLNQVMVLTIVHINRFGNIVLNIKHGDLKDHLNKKITFWKTSNSILTGKIATCFADVARAGIVMCDDGYGRCCLAMNQDDLTRKFNVCVNDNIYLRIE